MLVRIKVINEIGFLVIPSDAEVGRVKHFAQLIAHQIHNRLKVQLGGEALLDGVDDLQFGVALFEMGVRGTQFFSARFHLLLQPLRPLRIVQRHRGLIRQQTQHIAVHVGEHAVERGHVHIQVAEDAVLGNQRCDDF
jgi:hypothetical protein